MSKKTAIINAQIVDPDSGRNELGNLYIDGKIIAHIGTTPPDGFTADQTIDATDQILLPGVIDLSTYLREPGQEFKATIESESYAAVSAGITQLYYMPEPETCIDNMPLANLVLKRGKTEKKARINAIGAITQGLKGEQLTNMGGLKYAGCAAVTNQRQAFANTNTLRMAMDYSATFDLPLFLHPIDHALMGKGCVHQGAISTRVGLPGIPSTSETTAVAQIITLAEELNVSVHLCRLSASGSVELVRTAKQKGLPVTADVAAHQLFLTDFDISCFDPLCHVQPPFRSQRDLDALRNGVADGTIDAICSDHQPHEIDAKLAPFQQTEPGISALETLLPLTMRLVEEGAMPLETAIASITSRAAKTIRDRQGKLQVDLQADFTLYDPNDLWRLSTEKMLSQGKNTPFAGWSFSGRSSRTFVKGECVFIRNDD
ncbi:MAG TPA: dihydroorotase [Thiothrix sp.]|nr:dihydroorotase [Thiothrix sp.]